MSSSLRTVSFSVTRILQSRGIHLTGAKFGDDIRDKRLSHKEQPDTVEGELGTYTASKNSFELIDERLHDRVINGLRFKDIPIIQIMCTRNNTKIVLKHASGVPIAFRSAGLEGFKNCRKGTTVAAQAVANRIVTIAKDNEISTARMVFDGLGPGRNAAYKVFELSGLNIVSLSDRTQAAEPFNNRPRAAKSL